MAAMRSPGPAMDFSLANNGFIGRPIGVILIANPRRELNEVASCLNVGDHAVVNLAPVARTVDDRCLAEPLLGEGQHDPAADAELPRFFESDKVGAAGRGAYDSADLLLDHQTVQASPDRFDLRKREASRVGSVRVNSAPREGKHVPAASLQLLRHPGSPQVAPQGAADDLFAQ